MGVADAAGPGPGPGQAASAQPGAGAGAPPRGPDVVTGVPASGSGVELPRYPGGGPADGGAPHYPPKGQPGAGFDYDYNQQAQQPPQGGPGYPPASAYPPPPQQYGQPAAHHAGTPGYYPGAGDYREPLPCLIGYQIML